MGYPWAELKCNESVDCIYKDLHNIPLQNDHCSAKIYTMVHVLWYNKFRFHSNRALLTLKLAKTKSLFILESF